MASKEKIKVQINPLQVAPRTDEASPLLEQYEKHMRGVHEIRVKTAAEKKRLRAAESMSQMLDEEVPRVLTPKKSKTQMFSQGNSARKLFSSRGTQYVVDESKFESRLPERVATADQLGRDALKYDGKMQFRAFDGDLCQTREEALAKFRERQIKEAMVQAPGTFFANRQKRIKRVDMSDGGVVNLIMRQASNVQTTGSRAGAESDQTSVDGS